MKSEKGMLLLFLLCGHALVCAELRGTTARMVDPEVNNNAVESNLGANAVPDTRTLQTFKTKETGPFCIDYMACVFLAGGPSFVPDGAVCCPGKSCCGKTAPTTSVITTAPPTTPVIPTSSPITPVIPTSSPTTPVIPTSSPITPVIPTSPPTTPVIPTSPPTTPVIPTSSPTTPAIPRLPPITPTPTASATTAAPAASSATPFPWVTAHNQIRQMYHEMYNATFVPVQRDTNLAADAQKYADFLIEQYVATGSTDEATCLNVFRTHGTDETKYGGENRYASFGFGRTPDEVLQNWAGDAEAEAATPTFTQVIWRATKWIGCGVASSNGCYYTVCRYVAPGNCLVDSTNPIASAMADTSPCPPLLPKSTAP